jgi:putative membrane protein
MESDNEAPIDATLIALGAPKWLHPTSIFFELFSTIRQFAFAAVVTLFLAGSGNMLALSAAGLTVLLTAISAVLRFATLRYQLVGNELRIDQGLIFRRHRVIPASRIQNIDLLQNPVHHFFGVAEVRIETAGGSEPEAKLRVLSLGDVQKLRSAVFAVRRSTIAAQSTLSGSLSGARVTDEQGFASDTVGASMDAGAVSLSPWDGEQTEAGTLLHQIGIGQLIKAGLISNRGFLLIPLVLVTFQQFDLHKSIDFERASEYLPRGLSTSAAVLIGTVASIAVLLLMRIFSVAWYLLRFYGYRLERWGEDLRVSCGLFTRVSATVPRRRIQFISIQQTLFGRFLGLAAIRIETAGGVGEKSEDAASTIGRKWFIPVIQMNEVQRLLPELRAGLEFDEASLAWRPTSPRTWRRLIRLAIIQSIVLALVGGVLLRPWGALVGLPALVVLIYFARRFARSLKFVCENDWILFRSGIVTRKLSITFFDKVQSVVVTQSPFDRRWDMATLSIDTAAAGPAMHSIAARYLSTDVANAELSHVAIGAASARLTGLR